MLAVHGTPSHLSLAIWHHSHTVLPATRHKWTHPAFTPPPQPDKPVLDLSTPEGWKAELT